MASRMDRYYEKTKNSNARSTRNRKLYQQIQDIDTYSNIEAVATIAKTNEIDITKVKELIKNRENYKKERQYRNALNIDQEKNYDEPVKEYFEKEKNYDIMDVLNKAKDSHEEDSTNRSLKNVNYDVIKELHLRKNNYDDSEDELKDLINTITSKKSVNDDDVGLFDELTSNTMVGEASSIHKILEEEKKQQEKIDNTSDMDKTFFTSAVSFSEKDFEDLKNIRHNVKRNNLLIIIILVLVFIIVLGLVIFLAH